MAFGAVKSISNDELNRETEFPGQTALSGIPGSSAKSSVISLDDDASYSEQEIKAVEQLEASRRQLESEIDVSGLAGKRGGLAVEANPAQAVLFVCVQP